MDGLESQSILNELLKKTKPTKGTFLKLSGMNEGDLQAAILAMLERNLRPTQSYYDDIMTIAATVYAIKKDRGVILVKSAQFSDRRSLSVNIGNAQKVCTAVSVPGGLVLNHC